MGAITVMLPTATHLITSNTPLPYSKPPPLPSRRRGKACNGGFVHAPSPAQYRDIDALQCKSMLRMLGVAYPEQHTQNTLVDVQTWWREGKRLRQSVCIEPGSLCFVMLVAKLGLRSSNPKNTGRKAKGKKEMSVRCTERWRDASCQ
jgi:hypothetical protein